MPSKITMTSYTSNPTSFSKAFAVFNTVDDFVSSETLSPLGFLILYYPVSPKNVLAMPPPCSSFSCPLTPGIPHGFTLGPPLYIPLLYPLII